jgi:hypothetical protein
MDAAYIISVATMEALGVGLPFYIVNVLPLRHRLKAVALCLTTFHAFVNVAGAYPLSFVAVNRAPPK